MNLLLLKFIIFSNIRAALSVIIHEKGPTHRKLAETCLEEIIREHFHFQYGKSDVNHTMLLTVIVTNNLDSPAFEIQEAILKKVHELAKWYQIEIVAYGERYDFESYAECLEDDCQKSFVIDFKTNFYVIVVDSEENLDTVLDVLEESNTFNPKALYLVYFEYNESKYEHIAKSILIKMWSKLLVKTAVLIPQTLQIFNLYRLNTGTRGPYECESNVTLAKIDQCVKGNMLNIKKHYYNVDEGRDFLNCSVGVIAREYKPFVINEAHGFEIRVLESIAEIINVHLNITMRQNVSDTWGAKENGSWTGRLKMVYENYFLGVGNVETGMDYATDFSFSIFYHMEPLVFVVPIARYVPKWRVLIAIFTAEMWGICVGIIISFAISFYIASKFGREVQNFRSFGECLYQSLQVIIYHAVPTQPISDFTRVFFISLSIISIIMASAYTCSLVYYLKNPIREHQATDISDMVDSFGKYKYGIGGVSRYRELFSLSDEDDDSELYKMYQTASGENDTLLYWIEKVAENRNIWTVSSKLYANYLLSKGSTSAVTGEGKPKIYVFKKQLMSYSISLIMRKGHPLLRNIDYAIQRLTWAGLVTYKSKRYTQHIQQRISMINQNDDDTYTSLAIEDLQGAFALLGLGFILGFASLTVECILKIYKTRKLRTVGVERVKNMNRIKSQRSNL